MGRIRVLHEELLSRRTRAEAVRRRNRWAEQYRRDRLRELDELLALDAKAYARRAEKEPVLRGEGRVALQQWRDVFGGVPRPVRERALQGRASRVTYGDLSPGGQAAVKGMVRGVGAGSVDAEGRPRNVFHGSRDFANVVVEVRPGGISTRRSLSLSLLFPPSREGRLLPDLLHRPRWDPQEGDDWSSHAREYLDRRRGPKDRARNPALQRRVTLEKKRVEDVLEELAAKSGLPVIGEYGPCFLDPFLRHWPGRYALEREAVTDRPVWEALDIVTKRFDLEWDFQKGWIWIRSPRTLRALAGELDLSPPEPEPRDEQQAGKH